MLAVSLRVSSHPLPLTLNDISTALSGTAGVQRPRSTRGSSPGAGRGGTASLGLSEEQGGTWPLVRPSAHSVASSLLPARPHISYSSSPFTPSHSSSPSSASHPFSHVYKGGDEVCTAKAVAPMPLTSTWPLGAPMNSKGP